MSSWCRSRYGSWKGDYDHDWRKDEATAQLCCTIRNQRDNAGSGPVPPLYRNYRGPNLKARDQEKDSNLNLKVGKACKSTGAKGDEGSRCRGRFGECRRRVERVIDGKNHYATKTVLQNLT